jgi:hypothetical protein
MIFILVLGVSTLGGFVGWLIRRHWRMYDDPKFAVKQARRESNRLQRRPFSDRSDEDAAGPSW